LWKLSGWLNFDGNNIGLGSIREQNVGLQGICASILLMRRDTTVGLCLERQVESASRSHEQTKFLTYTSCPVCTTYLTWKKWVLDPFTNKDCTAHHFDPILLVVWTLEINKNIPFNSLE